MNVESARYSETGSIVAVIDGAETCVPDDPGNRHRQAVTAWELAGNEIAAYAPPAPLAADVKAEAYRRIVALAPEWKQRNMIARGVELVRVGESNWTDVQQAEVNAMDAIWATIKDIREASDALETMDPIPVDYADDSRWP